MSMLIIFFALIKYKVLNKNHLKIDKNTPVIFVSNHSSFIDIPLIESILGSRPRIWISRKIFGLNTLLRRMHVIINRKAHSDAKHALTRAIDLAKTHNSDIILFPEGHRYGDGQIHKFYSGFAVMAETLDRPIIPIAISGLNKVFPPESFCIDSGAQTVKISIGKSISYKDFKTREDFIDYTHKWFVAELEKLNHG